MYTPDKIRNIAIIAHIDHGKTTMLDALFRQSKVYRENEEVLERAMDSFSLEKERGITIYAKHTSLFYNDYKINIIDTPGHADFSGEVERVLGMVNSALLLIDAQEGPMPQTRFVLSLALKMGLKPLVVLNKIDRPHANPDEALNKTFDLFVELGASDEQLDFKYCFASGLGGFAMAEIEDPRENMNPLFDIIVREVPAPPGRMDQPFLMQVSSLSYDDFVGRQATGRILEGTIKKGQNFTLIDHEGHPEQFKASRIEGYHGLKKVELAEAGVGDIVSISGAPEVMIGDTFCDSSHIQQLPPISLGRPTISIDLMVNSSPFVGKDGKHVTMNKLRDRLMREKKANITLQIEEVKEGQEDAIRVSGRGELHLSILIETLRREDYEFSFSKPKVIFLEIDNEKCEPFESVHIEVPDESSGTVIEELMRRRGEMQSLSKNEHDITTIHFLIPSRGLMGYRNEFLTATKGEGILTSVFDSYKPMKAEIPSRQNGSLISICRGKATPYAMMTLQERGILFLKPTDEVYEGMIVGEHNRSNDLVVNITKEKHLTNVRSSGADEHVMLIPPRLMTLEQAIDFIEDDELVEVTPKHIRLRKRVLNETERKRKS
ncbi:MAG: translational GTPase TypA [Simkaniaceae bacterium]|nr:translational GTPase TypA [Simkaniaceae bacterium]